MTPDQKVQATQTAFMMVERLATLCATPGINQKTQELANEHIQALLSSAVKTAVQETGAKGVGLIV